MASEDAELRAQMRSELGARGHEVAEVADAEAARSAYQADRHGLVIVDADLPHGGAYALCRDLREAAGKGTQPLFLLHDARDREAPSAAYEAGASDVLTKPIDWERLFDRLPFLARRVHGVAELRRELTSLKNAQRLAGLGNFELHYATRSMRWSDEVYRILGLSPEETAADAKRWWSHVHPADRDRVQQGVREALEDEGSYVIEHRVVTPDGRVRHVRQQAELVIGGRTEDRWLVGTLQDVTEQKLASHQIWYLANFDHLTGLANRRQFHHEFEEAIARARRSGRRVGLLYLDLDDFKRVNDSIGHSAGDRLLRHVGDLLRGRVRASDLVARPVEDEAPLTISRLGGDEFTVLLTDMESQHEPAEVAERILGALQSPIPIEGQDVAALGSIGIAVFPDDGNDVETLMKSADTAMYHAKEKGRNRFEFFRPSMTEALVRRLELERRLRTAIESGGMSVHFQAKIDLRTQRVCGAEALLRWQDENLGVVSPGEIIPVAEETGLIVALGQRVLEEATSAAARWAQEGHVGIPVAVNFSPLQLCREDAGEGVTAALQTTGLAPSSLEIEITESVLMQDDDRVATMLRDLRAMGIRVALDDFGTGYSSLSYLTRFPLDVLKLDRCFTRDVDTDPAGEGVVRAVVGIAHSLGLSVVAEGIDSEDQARVLRRLGCEEGQGFHFSPALPYDEFLAFLQSRESLE